MNETTNNNHMQDTMWRNIVMMSKMYITYLHSVIIWLARYN